MPTSKKLNASTLIIALGVLLVLFIMASGYLFYRVQLLSDPKYQTQIADENSERIIRQVGTIYELPAEKPKVLVVSDVDKLKEGQAFYKIAKNDDAVLVFTEFAILYRPSTHKIITVVSVTQEEPGNNPPTPSKS